MLRLLNCRLFFVDINRNKCILICINKGGITMTDKAYIVANKEQELDILKKV